MFAKGQPLEGTLVVLRPDEDYPLALNFFDMGQSNPALTTRDRRILQRSAVDMIMYCLGDMTGVQRTMAKYLIQLAMVIPNANIGTIREMLRPQKGTAFLEKYARALEQVDPVVRDYFADLFSTTGEAQTMTRQALLRRVMAMLDEPVFRKMYQSSQNKVDMLREIEAGKVILINTDLAHLGHDACETFGRFFIALLMQATFQRTGKSPVFCYIDEAHDYIAQDSNVASLIDKARQQRVAFIFAHQRLNQIKSPDVLDALSNVPIKFASKNETDARELARYMRTEPEFILNQPEYSFAAFVRGQTPHAISITANIKRAEALETMTDEEYADIERDMRERYCVSGVVSPSPPNLVLIKNPRVTDAEWEDVV